MSRKAAVAVLIALLAALLVALFWTIRSDAIPEEVRHGFKSPRFEDRYGAVFDLIEANVPLRPRIGILAEALEAELNRPYEGPRPDGSWFNASEVLLWNYASAMGLSGEEALSLLRRRERRASGELREWLQLARGYAGDPEAPQLLTDLLRSGRPAVRAEAARLLGELEIEPAAAPLEALLDDPFSLQEPRGAVRFPVREAAAGALRRLGHPVRPVPGEPGRFEVVRP